MEFQEAFEKAGTLGRAQLLIIVMVFVAYIFAGWQAVTPVFTGIEVPFYCADNKSSVLLSSTKRPSELFPYAIIKALYAPRIVLKFI